MSLDFPAAQSDISARLVRARREIAEACARSGRTDDVTVVAVTKTFPPSAIDAAVAAGLEDIGENRVQELREKVDQVTVHPRWHMIGHLQSNKVRDAVRLCDVIQTVDSLALAERIGREAASTGREMAILFQVNIGSEPQKSGLPPGSVLDMAREAAAVEGLRVRGLMAIPPLAEENQTRDYFRQMRKLSGSLQDALGPDSGVLSMGMSGDFVMAVEEGATMVRLGSYLFGGRS
ncbi:MAG: YggS family pyridoxal phosphate-dependent enzyme [Acidobacteriota bacterium]